MADGMTKARMMCLKTAVVAGANADTNIAITGIAVEDELVGVFEFATAAAIATLTNRLATTEITSAGNIQCSVATASDSLLVMWNDVSA